MKDPYEGFIWEDPNRNFDYLNPTRPFGSWQEVANLADPSSWEYFQRQQENARIAAAEAAGKRFSFGAGGGPIGGGATSGMAGGPAAGAMTNVTAGAGLPAGYGTGASLMAGKAAGAAGTAATAAGAAAKGGGMWNWLGPGLMSLATMLVGRGKTQTLDPEQQRLMNQALQIQNARMLLQNPLYETIIQGAMSRQPGAARVSNYQLANLGQYGAGDVGARTPGAGAQVVGRARRRPMDQALSEVGRNIRQPYV